MSDIEEKEIREMTVEELLKQYKHEQHTINLAQKRQDEIIEQILNAKDRQWDMITVRKAAMKSGLSIPTIYRFINTNKLKIVQHKGTSIMVSEKELLDMDDKYTPVKVVAQ